MTDVDRVPMPSERTVSPEFVEHLRRLGMSHETVDFADRFVARFTRRDMERATSRAFGFGVATGAAIVVAVVLVGR